MKPEHFDIVIVGAGLSGIGLACRLKTECPDKTFVILEARSSMGGTWDLFRYPGIRSDSDMYTLGYDFRPWRGAKDIADGPSILKYIQETATEYGIEHHIRYDHAVHKASWTSSDASWIVEGSVDEKPVAITCNMLLMCAGYYSYEAGHTPEFNGRDDFDGQIVHPQHWPDDLDVSGKRVIVIGSGATAVTIVPAIAEEAESVVMLQRSPTYMVSRPTTALLPSLLRKVLPARTAYAITRWWNISLGVYFYRRSRAQPKKVRKFLIEGVRKWLGREYDVEKHFAPTYDPWDQRLCLVPDGDLFEAIKSGKAQVVTDEIDRFTEEGIRLKSGQQIDADLIVTATGLRLKIAGGVEFVVDGRPVDISQTYTYKGMMNSGVPNLISTFGYVNASWTLRADLTAEFICRLINHMDEIGMRRVTPRLRADEQTMPTRPYIENFSSNYIRRALDRMPQQGDREPWVNTQDYKLDVKLIRRAAVDDGSLEFDHPAKTDLVEKQA